MTGIASRPLMAPNPTLPVSALVLLLAGVLLAVGPHVPHLPWWVTLLSTAMILWRGWAAWKNERLPRRWLLTLLVLAGVAGVYLTHRSIIGRDAGITLLVLFLSLKLMEMRRYRDAIVVTFLCYFLALTTFFYSQTLAIAGVALLAVLLVTAGLVGFNGPQRRPTEGVKVAGMLLAQGVPVMVCLFFFFPRVQGPLWGLPAEAFGANSGLSDSMAPGNISLLSQSDAIAFRAKFIGDPPERKQLYWRGPVFRHFDGHVWRAGDSRGAGPAQFESLGNPIFYTVTIEPHERRWLFALDLPGKVPPDAAATGDYQLLAHRPVLARLNYDMSSFLEYRATGGASRDELAAARRLPEGFNPRALALGEQWRRELQSDRRIVARAVEYFQRANLSYTLAPPLLGHDSVDEFLFDTKRGFCEHFSAAFTVLMRAAGLPARVVTGYQGGEVNPIDGYLTVRQSDAHAWVEVWLESQGWVRVDPTAAAVPSRLESGLAAAVPASDPLPFLVRSELSWLRAMRFNWEALANYWNQWVVGYNVDRQRELLVRLGMPSPSWERLAMALFWLVGLVVAVLSLWILHRSQDEDPVSMAWMRFCRKLARRGTDRRSSEGPRTFAARAAAEHPHLARAVAEITQLYISLRYGPTPDATVLELFRQRVREFRS